MKKLWYILPLFLFFLVGCGSKSEVNNNLKIEESERGQI